MSYGNIITLHYGNDHTINFQEYLYAKVTNARIVCHQLLFPGCWELSGLSDPRLVT